jgi:predicted ATPase/DNA-binding SARP family transcriptional activator
VREDWASSTFSIRLFGPFEARVGGQPLPAFRFSKSRSILALLLLRHGIEVERDWLAGLLWPDGALHRGRHSLRNCLSDLRQALGPEAVRLLSPTSRTLSLDLTGATVDVLAFDAALARGDPGSLESAAALYRGPLLEGCVEEWAFHERQIREQAYLSALERLAGLAQGRGDLTEVERYLRLAVATDPLRESMHRSLMQALAAGGNYTAAVLVYRELCARLHAELNAAPDPGTRALFEQLRMEVQEKAADGRSTSSTSRFPGAGAPSEPPGTEQASRAASHSLPLYLTSFCGREAEVAQLGEVMRSGLREADRANVLMQRKVSAGHTRLVTLTGSGGSGKTRLAVEVARALRAEGIGLVCFVALGDLTDARLLPERIRDALGLSRTAKGEPLEQIVSFLCACAPEAQPCWLLLDNFEHLLPPPPKHGQAAPGDGAALVWQLLHRVEHLRVLITSRQRLGLPGEQEFPVSPLPLPDLLAHEHAPTRRKPDQGCDRDQDLLPTLGQCASVALFVDRARAVRPEFQLTAGNAATVARLCRRLEGLPLAIELAAARAGVLSPDQMLSRLESTLPSGGTRFELLVGRQRSIDPRHRSLRAALDWSYQLLEPELQCFFSRLSVFRGGWTLASAEAVCGQSMALECLERLRESSLVHATEADGEMRFQFLETLREYAAEQLPVDERDALARRHAQFFLRLAETAACELARPDQGLWLDRLEREHDNMRAALEWAVEAGEAELGLRLASALEGFWCPRGYYKEGLAWILRLLAHPGAAAPTAARAHALGTAGGLSALQGDEEAAQALYEESLSISRRLDDRAGIAKMLRGLGSLAWNRWDLSTARALAEENLALCRELGNPRDIGDALTLMCEICRSERDLPAARALIEESLAISRALDDRVRIASKLECLGSAAFQQRDLDTARRAFEESLAVATELEDKQTIGWALLGLGYVAHWEEDYPAARALFEQCLPLWQALGAKDGLIETLFHLARLRQHEGDYTGAYTVLEELGAVMRKGNSEATGPLALLGHAAADLGRWDEAAACCGKRLRLGRLDAAPNEQIVAWALTGMARVALARGRPIRAARLLGAVPALLAASQFPWWPSDHARFGQIVSAVRAQSPEAEFTAAWAQGEAMPVQQIIAEALEEAPIG